jgi:2-isopropylmalate synthase
MMKKNQKYMYPESIPVENRQWPDRKIENAPVWTSVDLRDGNQALPLPMNPAKKLEYYKLLLGIGFKEIEVGFPSASQDDYDFVRKLIEEDLVPEDVRISVLTQARRHLIDKTVESLKGVKHGVVHCYVATSDLHGRFVFGCDRDAVMKMAIEGTQMVIDALNKNNMRDNIGYEFSPEEFSDSDLDFTIELCKKVKETWGASKKSDFILNLPATVERRPPYQYADMIEYFCNKYPYLDETTISVHAHNDQGCAVAASEMALLAGADRVEGTIFGHGERTGNLDLVTLALNLHSRGIDTGLDFSNMDCIVETVERSSGIPVHPRHPYAGNLVFTAFSGSHQDAIRKGMDMRKQTAAHFGHSWKVPYLHIDPKDIGRNYEKLIRINSQSGKGGVVYVLESEFGIAPPKRMHPQIGAAAQELADKKGNEINSAELYEHFEQTFINPQGPLELINFKRIDVNDLDNITVRLKLNMNGKKLKIVGSGNGPISAAVHALRSIEELPEFVLDDFHEQTLGHDANAAAISFIGLIRKKDEKLIYGAGTHSNIDQAAIRALFSALNRVITAR